MLGYFAAIVNIDRIDDETGLDGGSLGRQEHAGVFSASGRPAVAGEPEHQVGAGQEG